MISSWIHPSADVYEAFACDSIVWIFSNYHFDRALIEWITSEFEMEMWRMISKAFLKWEPRNEWINWRLIRQSHYNTKLDRRIIWMSESDLSINRHTHTHTHWNRQRWIAHAIDWHKMNILFLNSRCEVWTCKCFIAPNHEQNSTETICFPQFPKIYFVKSTISSVVSGESNDNNVSAH